LPSAKRGSFWLAPRGSTETRNAAFALMDCTKTPLTTHLRRANPQRFAKPLDLKLRCPRRSQRIPFAPLAQHCKGQQHDRAVQFDLSPLQRKSQKGSDPTRRPPPGSALSDNFATCPVTPNCVAQCCAPTARKGLSWTRSDTVRQHASALTPLCVPLERI